MYTHKYEVIPYYYFLELQLKELEQPIGRGLNKFNLVV
jgi:hypothetical protein